MEKKIEPAKLNLRDISRREYVLSNGEPLLKQIEVSALVRLADGIEVMNAEKNKLRRKLADARLENKRLKAENLSLKRINAGLTVHKNKNKIKEDEEYQLRSAGL
jgi:hypothetical protein